MLKRMKIIIMLAIWSVSAAVAADAVKIGMITTLSTKAGYLGEEIRDGFRLAMDSQGGRLGGVEVQLLVEDDGRKPERGKQIAERYIKRENIKIITGIVFSNVAMAVVPKVVRSDVFYISPNAGPSKLVGMASHRIARAGLGLVPEGRQIFPNLRVWENLEVARPSSRHLRAASGGEWNVERVFALFPALAERKNSAGSQLSGGEQQMLAIGRALMTEPSLMILDEATEGLAPLVRTAIWQSLEALKAQGQSILLIDKNLDALLRIADRHYVMEKGRVVWQGKSAALANDECLKSRYLGV